MTTKTRKGLFLLSRILGLKTVTSQIITCVEQMDHIIPEYVFFDVADYTNYRTWNRSNIWKNTFEAAYSMREKTKGIRAKDYDFVFIHGYELMHGVIDITKQIPAALLTDTTDILSHKLINQVHPGFQNTLKLHIKDLVTKNVYAPAVRQVDMFMPMSAWCAQSFHHDYDVRLENMIITHAGLDLEHWKPSDQIHHHKRLKLLFVGNDLQRKGGGFILDVYRNHLQDTCDLIIVSTDPQLKDLPQTEGVTCLPGVENYRLIELFTSCDLFVFPSFNDKSPNVLKETAAAGLPIIARDVGGVAEIVQDGINGNLLAYNSSVDDWGSKIRGLLQNKKQLADYADASRKIALECFSIERFKRDLTDVFNKLCNETTQKAL